MNQACLKSLTLFIGWSTEVRREMTKAHEVECATLTRDIRALLAKRQVSPRMAQVVLINTLVATIKHLEKKDTMEEAAEDLVLTLQRAISKSH
jgi:hypothetical protein